MSHDYNMIFTDRQGKYQGSWAIQAFVVFDRIDEIRAWDESIFAGTWYDPITEGQYKAIEVKPCQETLDKLEKYRYVDADENQWIDEIVKGVEEAIRKNLKLFLM